MQLQVTGSSFLASLYGQTLSCTVPAYSYEPAMQECHKISASTKYWLFTIFRQNSAVSISAHRRLSKSGKSKKLSPSLFDVSFSIPDLHLEAVTKILCLSRELSQLGWGWRGERGLSPVPLPPAPITRAAGKVSVPWEGGLAHT
jgi:hypothetical protein